MLCAQFLYQHLTPLTQRSVHTTGPLVSQPQLKCPTHPTLSALFSASERTAPQADVVAAQRPACMHAQRPHVSYMCHKCFSSRSPLS
jgi:hypothetical protein